MAQLQMPHPMLYRYVSPAPRGPGQWRPFNRTDTFLRVIAGMTWPGEPDPVTRAATDVEIKFDDGSTRRITAQLEGTN